MSQSASAPATPFRLYVSVLEAGRMDRRTIEITAPNASAARSQLLRDPAYADAIVLKIKKVRS